MSKLKTLEGCAEAFSRLASRTHSTAAEWARLDAAIEALEEPTSVMLLADVRVEVARRADREGRADDALAACDRALASLPENADALLLRGALRRARGELELAEADWRAALDNARSAVADYADEAEEEEGEDWREDPVCRAQVCAGLVAQHELALLLSQLGRHAEADSHLAQLGMRYKLSPLLLQWGQADAQPQPRRPQQPLARAEGACCHADGPLASACSRGQGEPADSPAATALAAGQKRPLDTADLLLHGPADAANAGGAGGARDAARRAAAVGQRQPPEPLVVLDGVLPAQLADGLLDAFAPGAPFWHEHGYPTGHFFSYLRPLPPPGGATGAGAPADGAGGGEGGGAEGRGLLDEVIDALRPLVEAHAHNLAASAAASAAAAGDGARAAKRGGGGRGAAPEQEAEEAEAAAGSEGGDGVRMGWVEWWCHSRAPDGGHQLHFDLDEASLGGAPAEQSAGGRAGAGGRRLSGRADGPRSPAVSTILYLIPPAQPEEGARANVSAAAGGAAGAAAEPGAAERAGERGADGADGADGAVGGPTVVFDQRLGDGALAERAWLVRPARVPGGRLCLFDGGLLHGVLPGEPRRAPPPGAPAAAPARRLTLMMGWWPASHRPPRAAKSNGPPFAPCMREPAAPRAPAAAVSAPPRWPLQLLAPRPQPAGAAAVPPPAPAPLPLRALSPAWCSVPAACEPRARQAATTSGSDNSNSYKAAGGGAAEGGGAAHTGGEAPEEAEADSLAGGPALPADGLEEVSFFGKWFLPTPTAIDDELLGSGR